MNTHTALSIPHLFLLIALIPVGARVFGALFERIKQPPVLGEILFGILIGPSLLNLVDPHTSELHLFSEIGVALLLFVIGLETDLYAFLRSARMSFVVGTIGLVLPFLFGYGGILASHRILQFPAGEDHLIKLIAIFTGATLTATSVGITARILKELHSLQTREARIILGAAVIDDLLGIIVLTIVSSLALSFARGVPVEEALSVSSLLTTFLLALGFPAVSILIGLFGLKLMNRFAPGLKLETVALPFAISLAMAALATLSGSAGIIGSFAAGLVLGLLPPRKEILHGAETIGKIFTPFFFVLVGATLDLNALFTSGNGLVVGGILLLLAILGKLLSGVVVRGGILPKIRVGIGMVPRGEVGLICAQKGVEAGLLSPELFGAVMIVVMGSTLITPPLLQWVFASRETARG
jgi:Kef-type K+ transport system membrane component KefB